jgi:hypothetical protein
VRSISSPEESSCHSPVTLDKKRRVIPSTPKNSFQNVLDLRQTEALLEWQCSNTTAAAPGRSPSSFALVFSILVHLFTSFAMAYSYISEGFISLSV